VLVNATNRIATKVALCWRSKLLAGLTIANVAGPCLKEKRNGCPPLGNRTHGITGFETFGLRVSAFLRISAFGLRI
jgi:hypothetical protein